MRSSRPTVLAEPSAASTSWYLSEDDPELRTRTGAVIASPRCAEGRPQDWLRAPRRVGGRPRKDAVRRTPPANARTRTQRGRSSGRRGAQVVLWRALSLHRGDGDGVDDVADGGRSEEHTSELQSLMRISYAVLCL